MIMGSRRAKNLEWRGGLQPLATVFNSYDRLDTIFDSN
jgi:hypothetical protein